MFTLLLIEKHQRFVYKSMFMLCCVSVSVIHKEIHGPNSELAVVMWFWIGCWRVTQVPPFTFGEHSPLNMGNMGEMEYLIRTHAIPSNSVLYHNNSFQLVFILPLGKMEKPL